MTERPLNLGRSAEDTRDWDVSSFLTPSTIRDSYVCPTILPIRDQGAQTCGGAHVAACMKEWQEKKDYGYVGYMSPQFIYNNRSDQASGMNSREIMRILHKVGIVYEEDCVYGDRTTPSHKLLAKAGTHVISGYARVHTKDALKLSLLQHGPCFISFPAYNRDLKMWNSTGGDILGGHAMTVIGYTPAGFLLRNSWGTEWGFFGHCTYPFEEWGAHWEIWTTVDATSTLNVATTTEGNICYCTVL
jgi:hypothetical protein